MLVPFIAQSPNLASDVLIPASLRVLEDGEDRGQQRMFRVLTIEDGDKRIVWNADILTEIRDAATLFMDCIAAGMIPYRIGQDGRPAGVMREFDATAEEVLFAPIGYAAAG